MDDKKGPQNGSYTQIPNVFFDTCDLPESAQILYLRLYRHIAYKDDRKFVGSIRKLSNLVRLSKSTVDRMTKVLEESRLINICYELSQEQDTKIMGITINPHELWLLNKQHYEDKDVPNWDKTMPPVKILSQIGTLCPETGQHAVNLGQEDLNLGQTVPDTSSKSAQESISTLNEKNERMKESASRNVASENRTSDSTEPSFHSFTHSSLPDFCLEKIEQVAQTCGEDVDEYLEEAEELYQQSNKSEDIFYDLLFNAEAYINRYGPKTMQGFWDNMRKFLKAS